MTSQQLGNPPTASLAIPTASGQQESLLRIISDLRSPRPIESRQKSANELRAHVSLVARELTGESFTKFMNDINRRIFELIHSPDISDKLGGILAIDRLVDFEGEENATKITRFANYLRSVLPGSEVIVASLAARALGKLALSGGALTAEFVEFEVKRALEWLQGDRVELKRQAAVLVLKELIDNAPTILYGFVSSLLELLWVPLRDSKLSIREGAADAFHSCLSIVYQRESAQKLQWYRKIMDEVMRGFKSSGSAESIHGSLLACETMFLTSGRFMDSHFVEVADLLIKLKDNRDASVRKGVLSLMGVMAAYNPNDFIAAYLHPVMTHLLSQLKKDKDRPLVFLAIGKVSIHVESSIGPYLDPIVSSIKDGLTNKSRSKIAAEVDPIFQCLSMIAKAVGQAITKHVHELLDPIFAVHFSETVRQALVDISQYIPPLLPVIQVRLLNQISLTLSGQSYREMGMLDGEMSSQLTTALRDLQVSDKSDSDAYVLALNTLGTFDFTGHTLNAFIRDCVVGYLEDDNKDIRKSAALTCSQVLVKDPIHFLSNTNSILIVAEVLEKLLTVGIADPDPEIRKSVLESLDSRFDQHLAQPENIRSLFIALNDEVFEIREIAITIIGRLTVHNPAFVLPSLRKTLIQLMTDLEYHVVSRNKEESARLLAHLIAASQRLIKPYVEPILKVLFSKLNDPSPGVASQVLSAVGELAEVGREDLVPYLPKLMPLLIESLQDQSSAAKREATLKALGQLCTNTGFVIDAYVKYPQLLSLLMNAVKTEQIPSIRREVVKVLGILGALDPYRHKLIDRSEMPVNNGAVDEGELTSTVPSQNEDYYQTVAMNALIKILRDPSLNVHHTASVQAIMYMFKTLGLKCVPFLPKVVPALLSMLRSCPAGMLEFHFQHLGTLVSIVKQHIRNFLKDIFALIKEHWSSNPQLLVTILSLVESIAKALDTEFKVFVPLLLPQLLQIFETDMSTRRVPTEKTLESFAAFGSNIEEYLHLVLPAIMKLVEKPDVPIQIRKLAIQTVGKLAKKLSFADHASRIVHPLARVLQYQPAELRPVAMDTLSALVFQLNSDYVIFIPMIHKITSKHRIVHQTYELLISKLLKGEQLPQEIGENAEATGEPEGDMAGDANLAKKLPVNQQHLKRAWETSQRSTKEDWVEWKRRLSVELLKESPSHALRACASLANVYYPIARDLFNAAFISCWSELFDQFQDELVRALESALTSPAIPPETLQALLNLAEFMEHDDKALPIDIKTLGGYAGKCHAYAKALHYKELEFMNEPSPEVIEQLISINNQLQQPDGAVGVLTYAQRNHNLQLKESWYEKLNRWEDALFAYDKRQQEDPQNMSVTLGRMRCLHALGEWEQLSQLAQEKWFATDDDTRKIIAPLGADAAWGLGQWEMMDDYISSMKSESPDGMFFKSILDIHRNLFAEAGQCIDKTRALLDVELKALVGESYNRAYNVVVRVQMLAELDEIIQYKKFGDMPDRQAVIRYTWMKRLKGCQRNVEVWQRILKVRSLVMSPKEDMEMWIKFANLCRKSGRNGVSSKILTNLLQADPSKAENLRTGPPDVVYAWLKHSWATESKPHTFSMLKDFTASLTKIVDTHRANPTFVDEIAQHRALEKNMKVLARCYLKLGEWQSVLEEQWTEDTIPEVLKNYYEATQYEHNWYKAWHAWALANFEVVSMYEKSEDSEDVISKAIPYAVPAVQGFFKSIALSSGNSLQDTLRLLTIWFKYGYNQEVYSVISEGFNTVSIDTWLHVIPQLIARIHAPSPQVRRLTHQLLSEVGKEHPQALVYSLTVASKSQSDSRRESALAIMDKMRIHSSKLVEQALLVSQELIRVAILWHEIWHEGLEEASRLYFGEHNSAAMFAVLEPLHQLLESGPETLREISFNQAFGRDLQEALEWGKKYQITGVENDLHQAWDLYYQVFRRINKQLPQLTTLELQYVSPKLMAARDLELAVPGTYKSGEEIVKIAHFASTLTVITSKQRPRKLTIKGSDGRDYSYLLKGHEDLRQDERVMQLFGLVNTLLTSDPETFKRHLNIHRYPVIPLSPNSGLLGWVPNCDTLHTLIRDFRESKKILLNIEHRLMLQMAPDYDNLTLMQKVEVFQYALEQTTGQDLYKLLWLKSHNSEAWLERRTNYTRSLAVMSMVGYILGLGDRHPSNLMLERFTGKIIHIDFGDCFEVAMNRDKFPERIPFRLTRMLVNAMEVSGIEGSFRKTCEDVMRVLRENKESLMAVLEAFVYDPLINWRLLRQTSPPRVGTDIAATTGIPAKEYMEDDGVAVRSVGLSMRKLQQQESELDEEAVDQINKPEALNSKAIAIVTRVSNKLTGRDFKASRTLDVAEQVEKLIRQATSVDNLCQCYIGWCPFW
eukprot:Partr_v1_DN28994_c0_g1_i3_m24719 putative Phosphatidylinositol 3-kinase